MPQPNFSRAAQTGMDIAEAFRQGAGMQQPQQPRIQATIPPARAAVGGILPGTAGLRLTGNPDSDAIVMKDFDQYSKLWGMAYSRMKRENPMLSEAEIQDAIGPNPSRVTRYADFVDKIGVLQQEPAVMQHQLELDKMREKYRLDKEMFGEERAAQIAMVQLQQTYDREKTVGAQQFNREQATLDRAERTMDRDLNRKIAERTYDLQKQGMTFDEAERKARRTLSETQDLRAADEHKMNMDLAKAQLAKLKSENAPDHVIQFATQWQKSLLDIEALRAEYGRDGDKNAIFETIITNTKEQMRGLLETMFRAGKLSAEEYDSLVPMFNDGGNKLKTTAEQKKEADAKAESDRKKAEADKKAQDAQDRIRRGLPLLFVD